MRRLTTTALSSLRLSLFAGFIITALILAPAMSDAFQSRGTAIVEAFGASVPTSQKADSAKHYEKRTFTHTGRFD